MRQRWQAIRNWWQAEPWRLENLAFGSIAAAILIPMVLVSAIGGLDLWFTILTNLAAARDSIAHSIASNFSS